LVPTQRVIATAIATPSETPTAVELSTLAPTATATSTATPTAISTGTATETWTATPTFGVDDIPDLTFVIGSVIALQGETITIDVVLETTIEVYETQNDIILGPEIQFVIAPNGQPLCTVNPSIDKSATFTLDCDEAGVCALRTLILASGNFDPIPNGSALYSCEISINRNAALGAYPMGCAAFTVAEAPSTACIGGSVEVVSATPSPINTVGHHRDEDGCQVTRRTDQRAPWLLALLGSVLWLLRRRLSLRPVAKPRIGDS
jgi:hypothetical protein